MNYVRCRRSLFPSTFRFCGSRPQFHANATVGAQKMDFRARLIFALRVSETGTLPHK